LKELIKLEEYLSSVSKQSCQLDEYRLTSFTEGWQGAARQFAMDIENYGALGANMFNSAIGNMNSAIDNFVRTGKLNFKDFARSVIQDTMAMILKFQAMQLVMMGMKAFGFNPFGGAGGSVSIGAPVPVKAAGGSIDRPSIVGENGPELFIPSRSGTIVPNMQMGQALQGQPSGVYNGPYSANMSAIDTQSGIQFLSKNKSAVWAANQSAQRSLPMSK